MWMVRAGSGGHLADEFKEQGVVAIGWSDLGDLGQYKTKDDILQACKKQWPDWRDGQIMSSASQLLRFREKLSKGDRVITYDSSRRIYHVGTITGDYSYNQGAVGPMSNTYPVNWEGEIDRDVMSVATRNSLGSTLTLFKLSDTAASEVEALQSGVEAQPKPEDADAADEESLLDSYKTEAFEIIKDRVNRLDWEQMQELVAALLRAMGYKTRVATRGPDRGVDIMASPDGFGFESPRIIVEVKHRKGSQMGSQELRGFIGGRHKDDKGLYVSTGGFTKDAKYEADRANIPVMLMDIDELVKAILQNYDEMDMDGRNLLPLKKIYWPV